MTTKSSFLPSLRGNDRHVLPFYNAPRRKDPSEYPFAELSPSPDDGLLTPDYDHPSYRDSAPAASRRNSSTSAAYSDHASNAGSASKQGAGSKRKPRVLFAGPPPPIASSRILYRDEEEVQDQSWFGRSPSSDKGGASSFARSAIHSVLFDRKSSNNTRDQPPDYEPDTVWRNLQRRERVLQKELQHLLDVQSAGLAANLGGVGGPTEAGGSGARSDASDGGSHTPTGTLHTAEMTGSRWSSRNMAMSNHTVGADEYSAQRHMTTLGEVVPVRQPRKKPMGLRAARASLGRNMALLADLKADEDASLASAMSTRKRALAQLRRLAGRRDNITEEMRTLESDGEEPLTQELRELGEENDAVATEIAELEERLTALRNRKRWLEERTDDVRNRREAGLSGYKGALKEVDSRVNAILRKPPVKPLDVEAITSPQRTGSNGENAVDETDQSPGGVEFLRMRPERRTVEMAKQWWEKEVEILEKRKADVDRERAALEEGAKVWRSAIKLVSDFEMGLYRDLNGDNDDSDSGTNRKGKNKAPTPEEAIVAQLSKMRPVLDGLEQHLRVAEEKGWNLLICAIGAELVAFKEGESLLREALQSAGYGDDEHVEEKSTTPLARSGIDRASVFLSPARKETSLVDLSESTAHESDGADQPKEEELPHGADQEESENEVPPEFLAEHHDD